MSGKRKVIQKILNRIAEFDEILKDKKNDPIKQDDFRNKATNNKPQSFYGIL